MKCGYPPCGVELETSGDNWSAFCEKHRGVKCNFPPCKETIIENSDVCERHREMVNFFDWLHKVRHVQAQQQLIAVQRSQEVLRQAGLDGNGRRLVGL